MSKPLNANLKIRIVLITLLLISALSIAPVNAWWSGGHKTCTLAALSKAPPDMPAFFRAAGDSLSEMSIEPDNWKHATAPNLRATEQPEHYIDLEYFDGRPLPKTRFEAFKYYHEKRIDPSKGGLLPYALQEGYERLMLAFREARNRPDSQAAQQRVIVYAGWLAHYCQDAAMPLHTTIHFDGKAGANKAKPQKGIHEKIDAYPERNGFTPEILNADIQAQSTLDTWALIVNAIEESHKHVETCYELDKSGGFDKEPAKAREFILARTKAGAKLTLDLWYSAWKNSDPAKATIR